MSRNTTVVGMDIGHSAVKTRATTAEGRSFEFLSPSVVCQAFPISDEAEQRRAAEETVEIKGRQFFIGETARIQEGGGVSGLSEDWIDTPEHLALIKGAIKRVAKISGVDDKIDLVMGLPTHLHSRQKDRLKEIVMELSPNVGFVKVIPQSMGPYYGLMIGPDGQPAKEHDKNTESWGVVEVGYFSTDFMMAKNGRWVEEGSNQDACPGVRAATESLVRLINKKHQITIDLLDADEALRTRFIKHYGKQVDVSAEVDESVQLVVDTVIDSAIRLMESSARKLDGVLVAGGGAPLVFEHLRQKWPHAVLVDQPRFAVAEGMRRLGLALTLIRNKS